ncbi:hypothetical protein I204_07589 [Kwoniella mangroviensis CBS 8886]|nr:hypothetical protein I204_07589 [Kwoniella mangroviensis CBS 8886]
MSNPNHTAQPSHQSDQLPSDVGSYPAMNDSGDWHSNQSSGQVSPLRHGHGHGPTNFGFGDTPISDIPTTPLPHLNPRFFDQGGQPIRQRIHQYPFTSSSSSLKYPQQANHNYDQYANHNYDQYPNLFYGNFQFKPLPQINPYLPLHQYQYQHPSFHSQPYHLPYLAQYNQQPQYPSQLNYPFNVPLPNISSAQPGGSSRPFGRPVSSNIGPSQHLLQYQASMFTGTQVANTFGLTQPGVSIDNRNGISISDGSSFNSGVKRAFSQVDQKENDKSSMNTNTDTNTKRSRQSVRIKVKREETQGENWEDACKDMFELFSQCGSIESIYLMKSNTVSGILRGKIGIDFEEKLGYLKALNMPEEMRVYNSEKIEIITRRYEMNKTWFLAFESGLHHLQKDAIMYASKIGKRSATRFGIPPSALNRDIQPVDPVLSVLPFEELPQDSSLPRRFHLGQWKKYRESLSTDKNKIKDIELDDDDGGGHTEKEEVNVAHVKDEAEIGEDDDGK